MSDVKTPQGTKKRESLVHRTATTSYPCYGQVLGEFGGSWSCTTFPTANVVIFLRGAKNIRFYHPIESIFLLILSFYPSLFSLNFLPDRQIFKFLSKDLRFSNPLQNSILTCWRGKINEKKVEIFLAYVRIYAYLSMTFGGIVPCCEQDYKNSNNDKT